MPCQKLLIFVVFISGALCEKNNVCREYIDYLNIEQSPNCWYDPDVNKDFPDIMKNHGYPWESHNATTQDGYILTIFRMIRKNAKEVFVLIPPMTGTALNYIKSGNASLAFALYDAGYDVWLPNQRGTYYSRKHVYLNESQEKYWDFSFHEISIYDVPAILDVVTNVTKRNDTIVIGYSMTATSSLIYSSLLPKHAAEHVKVYIAIGPTAYAQSKPLPFHLKSDTFFVQFYTNHAESKSIAHPQNKLVKAIGKYTAVKSYDIAVRDTRRYCLSNSLVFACTLGIVKNAGGTPTNFDPAVPPRLFMFNPTRVSYKIIQHYDQIAKSDRFQEFDYGAVKNLMIYNSPIPPEYPLERTSVPVYIIHGDSDASCTVQNVERIYRDMSDIGRKYGKHLIKGYNHVDYIFSKTSKTELTDHIINFTRTNFK